MDNVTAVTFTEKETAVLAPLPGGKAEPKPGEVAGRTLATLVSPGTEINSSYLGERFPSTPGYSAVFEVEQAGEGVEDVSPGERIFCMGGHRSWQCTARARAVKVPEGLTSQKAVAARLMGVSMTTLRTTTARPGDLVMVTGLGPVGHLASLVFLASGYRVTGVDPDEARRKVAERSGLDRVIAEIREDDEELKGKVALQLECSGHEAAAADGCKVVKKRGEIVQIGTPWVKRTDRSAHEIVHAVFHNYVVLRSGWEWELPVTSEDFRPGSIVQNFETALAWLAEGRVKVDGLFSTADPKDAQQVYQNLMHRKTEFLSTVFEWK